MTAHDREKAASVPAPRPMPPDQRDPWPSFLRTFAWVGVNTFGGPVAQIGVMHQLAVEDRKWLDEAQFLHLLNFANILPGPEALEIAIHLGYLRRGTLGGIVSGLLFIWPGFLSLTALAWVYSEYGHLGPVGGFLDGVRPVAVALIASAVMRLATKSLKGVTAYLLMAAAFVASFSFAVPFIALLLACGVLGIGLAGFEVRRFARLTQPLVLLLLATAIAAGFLESRGRPATPPHEASVVPRTSGPASRERLAEIGWVNTKAAMLTFGGAYTVLPYLREQMVDEHGWVTDPQMVDALAMGETTPGPLISIAIFLSYLAGGFAGAATSCLFLFLPSFLLVLGLGRYIEGVERIPYAPRFLWGVSAGTIGLIVSLSAAVVPQSIHDVPGGVLAAVAFVALWRFRANILLTVAIGGALGIARSFR